MVRGMRAVERVEGEKKELFEQVGEKKNSRGSKICVIVLISQGHPVPHASAKVVKRLTRS